MVPFYGTVYKSSLYDLIIPFPACESGAEREKRRAVVFASGKTGKANNLIINSLWIVFYVEWHQLLSSVAPVFCLRARSASEFNQTAGVRRKFKLQAFSVVDQRFSLPEICGFHIF